MSFASQSTFNPISFKPIPSPQFGSITKLSGSHTFQHQTLTKTLEIDGRGFFEGTSLDGSLTIRGNSDFKKGCKITGKTLLDGTTQASQTEFSDSLHVRKKAELSDISVGKAAVFENFTKCQGGIFLGSLQIQGDGELSDTCVAGKTLILGRSTLKDSVFEDTLTVYAKNLSLSGCAVKDLVIKEEKIPVPLLPVRPGIIFPSISPGGIQQQPGPGAGASSASSKSSITPGRGSMGTEISIQPGETKRVGGLQISATQTETRVKTAQGGVYVNGRKKSGPGPDHFGDIGKSATRGGNSPSKPGNLNGKSQGSQNTTPSPIISGPGWPSSQGISPMDDRETPPSRQTLTLENNTVVQGKIIFEGKNGVVRAPKDCQIDASQVVGGVIRRV
ncbi:MAG: hypothetical protein K2X66_06050 [Cyanobacteria bacterium]|nr:hypothetical protein [Cyanobacteriota bacterium]